MTGESKCGSARCIKPLIPEGNYKFWQQLTWIFTFFFSGVIIKAWKDIIIDNKDEIYIIIFRIISWIIICRTAPVFDLRKSVRSGD